MCGWIFLSIVLRPFKSHSKLELCFYTKKKYWVCAKLHVMQVRCNTFVSHCKYWNQFPWGTSTPAMQSNGPLPQVKFYLLVYDLLGLAAVLARYSASLPMWLVGVEGETWAGCIYEIFCLIWLVPFILLDAIQPLSWWLWVGRLCSFGCLML